MDVAIKEMNDKRIKTGAISLPRDHRGNIGNILDKVGMNSESVTVFLNYNNVTPATTTSTTYVNLDAASVFTLNRYQKVGFSLRARAYAENCYVDGTTVSFQLYDAVNDNVYCFIDTFGDVAYDSGSNSTWLAGAEIIDFDIFNRPEGLHSLTPQWKVSGTGTAVLDYVVFDFFTFGN